MRELSLNILDVAQNSVRASAARIDIMVSVSRADNLLSIEITDNGCGMDAAFVARVTDPFSTTRTTRKVGMGLPLLKMDAEYCGGSFELKSEKGKGTSVRTTYRLDHIDRPPLGDLAATAAMLINGSPSIRFVITYSFDGNKYCLDTEELVEMLDGVPINEPEILIGIQELFTENIRELNGGFFI